MRALLLLFCAGLAAAEPPEPPAPDCDKLLAAPRPEKAEDAEAWDGCLRGGGVSVVPKTDRGPAPDSEYALAVGKSLQQGALRVAGFTDPFAKRDVPGGAEGTMAAGSDSPGYAAVRYTAEHSAVAAGGRARLDRSIPPAERVETAFQAVVQPDPLAVAAAHAAQATYPTTFDFVRGWTGDIVRAFRPAPMAMEMPAPDYGKAPSGPAPRGFVAPAGPDLSSVVGVAAYGAGNELSKTLPYTNFRAAVSGSLLQALDLAPAALKRLTVDYVPGDETGNFRRVSTGLEFQQGSVSLSLSAGFETLPDKKGDAKTAYPGRARLNISF